MATEKTNETTATATAATEDGERAVFFKCPTELYAYIAASAERNCRSVAGEIKFQLGRAYEGGQS